MYKALVDTGAAICVMRSDIARRQRIPVKPVTYCQFNKLLTANCTSLIIRGQCMVPVRIGDFVTMTKFIVVKDLQYQVIIGMDFLTTHKACIDMDGPHLTIGTEYRTTVRMFTKPDYNKILQVSENVDIKSMHEAVVEVKLPRGYTPCISIIEAIQDPWQSDGILVART